MRKTAVITATALGLSLWAVQAQDTGAPPDRGDRAGRRAAGREGGPGGEGLRPPPSPVMAAIDANNDGVLDAEEIAKASEALKGLDRNGDGKVTPDEYRPQRTGGPGGPPPGEPFGPPRERPGAESTIFESTPLPKDEAEKKVLTLLDEMNQAGRGMMSVPRDDGRYLRILAECIGARNVVEIGTSHGYSAVWICLALRATGGRLTTFEIDAGRAALARAHFKRAGVESIVTLIEGDAHKEVSRLKDPIDLLFLDADKQGYIDYLEKLLPLVRPGGLIVAHNMSARQADPRYVKAITTNPALETLFVNLGGSGIGMTLKKR